MNNNRFISLFLFIILLLPSCQSDHEDSQSELVLRAYTDLFKNKYPQVDIQQTKDYSFWAEIEFTDEQGNPGKSWFTQNQWALTQVQINNLYDLPNAVKYRFYTTPFATYEILYIHKIERSAIEKPYYCIKVDLKCGEVSDPTILDYSHTRELFLLEDGTLLYDTPETSEQQFYLVQPDCDIRFLENNYPGCVILCYYNTFSRSYFIRHNGVIKQVLLSNYDESLAWWGTVYPLGENENLPQEMVDALHQEYSGYVIDQVSWFDSRFNKEYLVRLTKGVEVKEVYLTPDK